MSYLDTTDLECLNSATKYSSILTYHKLNPGNGSLLSEVNHHWLAGQMIIITEKVDGANGRVVVFPDGSYLIGSREEFFYASGDRIERQDLGIVPVLKPIAEVLILQPSDEIRTYYFEVFGGGGKHRVGQNAKQYTGTGQYGARLFDVTVLDPEVLCWDQVTISAWREHGGQQFLSEGYLKLAAVQSSLRLTPRFETPIPFMGSDLPTTLEGMEEMLQKLFPSGTLVALDEEAGGEAEGIVIRTEDRSVIAKARFKDYARTRRVQSQTRR